MNKWRPEGWKNLYQESNYQGGCLLGSKCFERGADAMLEAMREEIMKVVNPHFDTNPRHIDYLMAQQPEFKTWDRCRQTILELFREGSDEQAN